jgi:hypothetical protein
MRVEGARMDDRQKIHDRLRKKEQEVQALEERLRTARTYIQALQDVLKLLDGEKGQEAGVVASAESVLRAGSAVHKARVAILTASAPMHINALTEAIGGDSSREGRISLASSLAAYVRKGEIFTRPAPNTFGLMELGHKTIPDEDDGPPAGFGQTVPRIAPRQPPNPHATVSFGRSTKSATSVSEPEAPSEEIDDLPF